MDPPSVSVFKAVPVVAGKIAATQSNFPVYIKPSALTGWGAITLAEAQSSRWYSDEAKTTELAREIVSADEIHVKVPSLTTTTVLYVDYDGVRADYAVGDTYGRNAVWSDYFLVTHMEGNGNDSSGNTSPTTTGTVTFPSGTPMGQSSDTNGNANNFLTYGNTFQSGNTNKSFTIWAVTDNRTKRSWYVDNGVTDTSGFDKAYGLFQASGLIYFYGFGGGADYVFSAPVPSNGVTFHVSASFDSSTDVNSLYYNGALDGTKTRALNTDGPSGLRLHCRTIDLSNSRLDGRINEFRGRNSTISADWITTEYNNQNDVASFFGTVTDAGGTLDSDIRPSEITGSQGDGSVRAVRTHGQDTNTASRSVSITGADVETTGRATEILGEQRTDESRPGEVQGNARASTSRTSATHGLDTEANTKGAATVGSLESTASRPSSLAGIDAVSSARVSQLIGDGGGASVRGAETRGIGTDTTTRPAELSGSISSSAGRLAELHGDSTSAAAKGAQATGRDSVFNDASAELSGADALADFRPAEVRGSDVTTYEQSAEIVGIDGVVDFRSSELTGTDTSHDTRLSETSGSDSDHDARSANTSGRETKGDGRSATTTGFLATTNARAAQLSAFARTESSRTASTEGVVVYHDATATIGAELFAQQITSGQPPTILATKSTRAVLGTKHRDMHLLGSSKNRTVLKSK